MELGSTEEYLGIEYSYEKNLKKLFWLRLF